MAAILLEPPIATSQMQKQEAGMETKEWQEPSQELCYRISVSQITTSPAAPQCPPQEYNNWDNEINNTLH